MADSYWGTRIDYLLESRRLYLNDDYLHFLIRDVWKLSRAVDVVDFGCGFGFMGLKMLPLLPAGSRYTGVDQAPALLALARQKFDELPFASSFHEADVHSVPFEDSRFDVAVCHAVLMHLERPLDALREMVRVTKPGGLVITCEANRCAAMSLIHVDEIEQSDFLDLGFLQRLWELDRLATGRDGNIGARLPAMLHSVGLRQIECRISDRATVLLPPMDTREKELTYEALCAEIAPERPNDLGPIQERLRERGFSPEQIEAQLGREQLMSERFRAAGRSFHTFFAGALSFAFGVVGEKG